MIQAVAIIFITVGILGLAGSYIFAMQTEMWLAAVYIAASSLGALATGLVMNTLGDLSNTTRDMLTVLLADPNDKPSQCPKCRTLLTGDERFETCYRCNAALPDRPEAVLS